MGRIKSTLIKRTARQLVEKSPESFSSDFEQNKKALGNTMPSKRLRNRIAGYISRLKKRNHKILNNTEEDKNKDD
jgi:small subunit ribosomal protein S17e